MTFARQRVSAQGFAGHPGYRGRAAHPKNLRIKASSPLNTTLTSKHVTTGK
jgi:hypothetical protein